MEKRFFVDNSNIFGDKINLTDDEHNHLSKVLRLRVGDEVECFCDGGEVLNCKIDEITKSFSTLKILSSYPCKANPKRELTLFQALPKLDKLELVTQKVTEIGVGEIVPFSSTYCIAKENTNKIERLKKIVSSACKQCGRTRLTKISATKKFDEVLQMLVKYDLVIFANETESENSLSKVLSLLPTKTYSNIACVVGSEGGFSKEEIDKIKSLKTVSSVSLGNRILRTETASIVICGIVANFFEI